MNFYDTWSIDAMVRERQFRLENEARLGRIRRQLRAERVQPRSLRQAVGLWFVALGQRISGLSAREIAPRQTAGPSLT